MSLAIPHYLYIYSRSINYCKFYHTKMLQRKGKEKVYHNVQVKLSVSVNTDDNEFLLDPIFTQINTIKVIHGSSLAVSAFI